MGLPPIVVEIDGKRKEQPQVIARATSSCAKGDEKDEGELEGEERKRSLGVQQQTRARMKQTAR